MTRRVRLGGAFLDHDLAPRVLAAVPVARDRGRLRLARRGLLVALAVAQLAIAVPMLFLGHDHDAGLHAAHELGSFNLALAIAFAVGAIRPRLSAGLAWPCAIAAGGLVTTAVIDLIGGQAIGADEAQHLVALAGAALLVWQSRLQDTASAAPAIVPGEGPAATLAGAGAAPVARLEGAPDHPWGGDAARITAPASPPRRPCRPTPRKPRPPICGRRPTPTRRRRTTRPSRDAYGTDHRPDDGAASEPDAPPRGGSAARDIELAIEGMTCAACAVRIEKKLNKLDDVRATVNYATGTARVTAPTGLPTEELIAAVERAGYTATAPAGEPRGRRTEDRTAAGEIRRAGTPPT